MPCRDDWVGPVSSYDYKHEAALQKRNDELAKLLCSLCREVENGGLNDIMPKPVVSWWKKHKAADEAREKAERDAKKAKYDQLKDEWEKLGEELGLD